MMTTAAPAIPVAVTVPRVAGAIILARPTYIPQHDIVYAARSPQDVWPEMNEITESMPDAEREKYWVVRLDSYAALPGVVVSANVTTGKCRMKDKTGTAKDYDFGPHAIRIMRR